MQPMSQTEPDPSALSDADSELVLLERLRTIAEVTVPDGAAAREHQLQLTKPPGSLGQLEDLGVQLAAIAGQTVPPKPKPATVALFAGDHGVLAEGVSPWPQEVTMQMVMNICGGGAAISAIASTNGLSVHVVNAGVATPLPDHPLLDNEPIGLGTKNIRIEAAMSRADALAAVQLGIRTAARLVESGSRCLITGDMGIGNTTPSAALIAAVTGCTAGEATGRGTGIDDETLVLKTSVVADAVARFASAPAERQSASNQSTSNQSNNTQLADSQPQEIEPDGFDLLAELGGYEIGGIAGLCLGGALLGVPVVIDGVISLAGALVAHSISPNVLGYLIAGHRSVEPGATIALEYLGLAPLVDLGLRLGEGSGGALAYPMVCASAAVMADMATFESAGIDGNNDE